MKVHTFFYRALIFILETYVEKTVRKICSLKITHDSRSSRWASYKSVGVVSFYLETYVGYASFLWQLPRGGCLLARRGIAVPVWLVGFGAWVCVARSLALAGAQARAIAGPLKVRELRSFVDSVAMWEKKYLIMGKLKLSTLIFKIYPFAM